jgi:hypothetical protein
MMERCGEPHYNSFLKFNISETKIKIFAPRLPPIVPQIRLQVKDSEPGDGVNSKNQQMP